MSIIRLRGRELHDALMALKPAGLSPIEWAMKSGLGRTFFNDLKRSDSQTVRAASLDSLLEYIGKSEIDLITAPPPPSTGPLSYKQMTDLPRDVPILGTASGANLRVATDKKAIEIESNVFEGDVVGFARRPPAIAHNRKVYVLLTQGDSMYPRYRHGDPLYVDPRQQPAIGDDAVVQLAAPTDAESQVAELSSVIVKELARRTATQLELKQYNPEQIFRLESSRIAAVHRVIPQRELLS
jgi:phage repressor protein C with HTH and peptisase S24 domain